MRNTWRLVVAAIATFAMSLIFLTQAIRDLTFGLTGRGAPSLAAKSGMMVEEA